MGKERGFTSKKEKESPRGERTNALGSTQPGGPLKTIDRKEFTAKRKGDRLDGQFGKWGGGREVKKKREPTKMTGVKMIRDQILRKDKAPGGGKKQTEKGALY